MVYAILVLFNSGIKVGHSTRGNEKPVYLIGSSFGSVIVCCVKWLLCTSGSYSVDTRWRALPFSSEQWPTIPWVVLRWIALLILWTQMHGCVYVNTSKDTFTKRLRVSSHYS